MGDRGTQAKQRTRRPATNSVRENRACVSPPAPPLTQKRAAPTEKNVQFDLRTQLAAGELSWLRPWVATVGRWGYLCWRYS